MQVYTNLATRESARRERFEPTGSITATNVQKAIEQAAVTPPVTIPTPITASPYNVLPTDTLLLVNVAAPVTINLGTAASRLGVPLTIKDISGAAGANNISIVPNGAETIDGLNPLPINSNFGGWKIAPQTGGYLVLP